MRAFAALLAASAALLAASAALADVAPRRPPPPSCSSDADCSISTYAGCCSDGCAAEPYATSNSQLDATTRRCAVIDCAARERVGPCPAVSLASQWRAVCRAGQCERLPASRDADFCASASECVSTDFSCCPGCCPAGPRALTRTRLAQEERDCATTECAKRNCRRLDCTRQPPASSSQAQCVQNRCVLASAPPPPPPAASCRRDAECAVTWVGGQTGACRSSPCGCCPGTTPVAVSVEQAGVKPLATKSSDAPPFGLNQGKRPACSPCPTPPPARAVCAAGQCTLAR